MKKCSILVLSVLLVACGGSDVNEVAHIDAQDLDALKSAYTQLGKGAVECKSDLINSQPFSACRYTAASGVSGWEIWYYDAHKDSQKRYYAVNGDARSTYENELIGNPLLGDYGHDIDPKFDGMNVPEIIKSF